MHAEVGHCDVAAQRDGELVLIEMKRSVTLDLLVQAVRRQEAHASVYAAVPAPPVMDKRWRERARLFRLLELGLLLVYLKPSVERVEVAFHPMPARRQKRAAATRAILREMAGRTSSLNRGGSSRRKLVTAYREQALGLAAALAVTGPTSPRDLRSRGCTERAGVILRGNIYGWFERLSLGVYGVTPIGLKALTEYGDLAESLRANLKLT